MTLSLDPWGRNLSAYARAAKRERDPQERYRMIVHVLDFHRGAGAPPATIRAWTNRARQALRDAYPERNPKKRREQTGFDAWQPDLFGGAHKERGEGKTRAEQMSLARQEMRDTGSRSLFELFDEEKPKRNPGPSMALLALVGVAGWWWLQRRPSTLQVAPPAIPSGADPNTGQYGQQTGQGYPPSSPPRTGYVLNPIVTDASTRVCSAAVLQMQAQHAAPSTTREGAGQAGPTGAWVYRDVVLPACNVGPSGDGRGGWGNGGH